MDFFTAHLLVGATLNNKISLQEIEIMELVTSQNKATLIQIGIISIVPAH
jgi:hypothetical protein